MCPSKPSFARDNFRVTVFTVVTDAFQIGHFVAADRAIFEGVVKKKVILKVIKTEMEIRMNDRLSVKNSSFRICFQNFHVA